MHLCWQPVPVCSLQTLGADSNAAAVFRLYHYLNHYNLFGECLLTSRPRVLPAIGVNMQDVNRMPHMCILRCLVCESHHLDVWNVSSSLVWSFHAAWSRATPMHCCTGGGYRGSAMSEMKSLTRDMK